MLCLCAVRRNRGRDHRIQETRRAITAETKEAEPGGHVSECTHAASDGTVDEEVCLPLDLTNCDFLS